MIPVAAFRDSSGQRAEEIHAAARNLAVFGVHHRHV